MATGPTTHHGAKPAAGPAVISSSTHDSKKSRGSGFTSWLKKTSVDSSAAKKLASPAEEIKTVFLKQLELSSVDLNGRHYHSVFTGAQIVDIIQKHFGLPDRTLATNIASRLIDCSLYTHVSGPSHNVQTHPQQTPNSSNGSSNGSNGRAIGVIDSNAEIYTLTADALAALKAMHKGDALQRAKTHTRRRYMDLRGHLHSRSTESQEEIAHRSSTSINASTNAASNTNRNSSCSSASLDNSSHPAKEKGPLPSNNSAATAGRFSNLPPPLDVSGARKVSTGFFRGRGDNASKSSEDRMADEVTPRGTHFHVDDEPLLKCDERDEEDETLAPSSGLPKTPVPSTNGSRRSKQSHQNEYLPLTPVTADNEPLPSYKDNPQPTPLQEVEIPTGDFGSLLNTWSFVATENGMSRTPDTTSRHSSLGLSQQIAATAAAARGNSMLHLEPQKQTVASDSRSLASPIITPAGSVQASAEGRCKFDGSQDSFNAIADNEDDCLERSDNRTSRARRRRWGMYRENSDGELNLRRSRRKDARKLRSYPSAPSLRSDISDDIKFVKQQAHHRPSLPLPRRISEFRLSSHDGWATGDDDDLHQLISQQRSSHISDITISSSSYTGERQFRSALLERSFVYNEGGVDDALWPTRSSVGSQLAEIQSSVAETEAEAEAETDTTSLYSSSAGVFVADDETSRQRSHSDPVDTRHRQRMAADSSSISSRSHHRRPAASRSAYQDTSVPDAHGSIGRRSSQTARLLRNYVTPDPPSAAGSISEVSGRASSVTLGSTLRNSESAVSEDGAMHLQLWRDTVPATLLQSLSPEAVARQEAIFELVVTEQAYLRDLELIDTVFVQPLLAAPHVMPRTEAEAFLHTLFFNYSELIENSRALYEQLRKRQTMSAVVGGVGDIFDKWADTLEPFVEYAVHVPAAQCALEAKLLNSHAMAEFLATAEAAPGARRLPVQSFIGRAATRFARYPLLLDAALRRTPQGDEDAARLRSAATKVRQALAEIDQRTGEGAAALRMRQIIQRLRLADGARENLGLGSPVRRLVKEGVFIAGDGSQVLVFLFDNALVMASEEKVPHAKNVTRYVADARIIPVSMLDAVVPAAEPGALSGIREALGLLGPSQNTAPRGALLRHSSSATSVRPSRTGCLPISFVHIGCRALGRTLLLPSDAERSSWMATIQQRICMPQTIVEAYTELRLLSDRDFPQARPPLCSALFTASSGCRMILFGSKDGLHMGIYGVPTSVVRVSNCGTVSKIHVFRRFNLVVVLSDQTLLVFALSAIENSTANIGLPNTLAGTKIASSVSFFDVGMYLGVPLIVLMKLRSGKSHFKCIQPQPVAGAQRGRDGNPDSDYSYDSSESGGDAHKRHAGVPARVASSATDPVHALRTVYQGNRAALRLINEFSVPGKAKRVYFLRRKLCIVGNKSFEIVDVANSRLLRSLPDQLDDDFSFVQANEPGQAMAIHKVGREFLLCYESFAFYIDNFGRRSRPEVFIRWEMPPQLITFRHPYIVAANQKFLEVRHIETGVLLSIIRIKNAICLNPDSKSTTLHIAVGPQPVGTATTIVENGEASSNNSSGMLRPTPKEANGDDSRQDHSDDGSRNSNSEAQHEIPATTVTAAAANIAVASPTTAAAAATTATVVSAMPTPLSTSNSSNSNRPLRPISAVLKSASILGTPTVISGHVVPGLAGSTGQQMFPEGSPSNYRIEFMA
ncbi:RHO1 GDP-GTP exchange protein 2 [Coemansia sp. Benny D115]|nr:RHO1 GDP-GTP exchange protein 2 [Coemansia sp. Benny D115]